MGILTGDSKKTTTNNFHDQGNNNNTTGTQDFSSVGSVDDGTIVDTDGGNSIAGVSSGKNSTINLSITDAGAIEGANEATLAALDNTALLAADTTGKLLGANDNITALAGVTVDNNTALAGEVVANNTALAGEVVENNTALAGNAIDDMAALSGVFSNNITALAGEMMGGANASAQAAANAASAAVSASNSSIALAGNTNDNITALAGQIVGNSNAATQTFSDFATTAHSNNTALAGAGFNALNANSESSLAVLNNIATEAMNMAETGMGAIRDTAGMGFTTAQNISGMGFTTAQNVAQTGLDKLGDSGVFAMTALSNESAHSKEALTTLAGYALAVAEEQYDIGMTQLGMSNRSAQADMVSIAGRSADLMSDTLGNVLTNGQVSMQQAANEGMKTVGWVAGAAVVAIVLMIAIKG
ncbi:hypothetical protein [Oceanospirillum sediminis]|uniref:Uncharacterized protein n=1 Tax=Oceanospirillum sediminis TaxID=2760088 RepID=A0A839IN38_9GAMM|nr:hypothetical protein [Oceanospirillum sediminis]MBB1485919.1 hypothetical protein [Oceanospirillum sediminis]